MSGKVAHFCAAQLVAEHPLAAVEPSDIKAAVDHISQMQSSVSAWMAAGPGCIPSRYG